MNKPPSESWEKQVADTAQSFSYPPTPNIADGIRQRTQPKPRAWRPQRLVIAAVVLLSLLIGLISVPTGRASLIEFLQFGAVRIWFVDPMPTAIADVMPTEALFVLDDDIMGALTETTLGRFLETDFSIRLPTYPATLGKPDRIFTLDAPQDGVLLVWLVSGSQNEVKLSLHQFNYEWSSKNSSDQLDYVRVNGKPALWLSEPHNLYLNTMRDKVRRVEGNVLIWVENRITYRLETNWPLSEALPFAESLVDQEKIK